MLEYAKIADKLESLRQSCHNGLYQFFPLKLDGIICVSKECRNKKECAQHESAGDFRTEDGFTPEWYRDTATGRLFCTRLETESLGSITPQWTIYTGPYDEVESPYIIRPLPLDFSPCPR